MTDRDLFGYTSEDESIVVVECLLPSYYKENPTFPLSIYIVSKTFELGTRFYYLLTVKENETYKIQLMDSKNTLKIPPNPMDSMTWLWDGLKVIYEYPVTEFKVDNFAVAFSNRIAQGIASGTMLTLDFNKEETKFNWDLILQNTVDHMTGLNRHACDHAN